ncbi:hypothetical protein SAV31267_020870 [Streptomyces avermitilis]|uniref:Uncharacterized protein n=1 Tax=Streptomyces avermitilis TaxID=33903 RepID=A0A4D4MKK0_STRAX|nr:hypothetical protein SAV31267_020870 [Streptomyces avermitilis]
MGIYALQRVMHGSSRDSGTARQRQAAKARRRRRNRRRGPQRLLRAPPCGLNGRRPFPGPTRSCRPAR